MQSEELNDVKTPNPFLQPVLASDPFHVMRAQVYKHAGMQVLG